MTIADDSKVPTTHSGTGKAAVLAMIAVALALATFAWWWNFNRGRHALEFYGAKGATLVRTAPRVTLLVDKGEIDISQVPGLLNARASLLSDASYRWRETIAPNGRPVYAVRFSNARDFVTVEFDFTAQSASASSTGKSAKLAKKTSAGWQQFIERIVRNSVKAH